MIPIGKTISFSETAGDDSAFRLISTPMPYYTCNIYILTQNAVYGDGSIIQAPQAANSSFWLEYGDLKDLWFKNAGIGLNTKIVAVLTQKKEEE